MKIVYLITALGHGQGGHFFDLATIAEELRQQGHFVTVVVVGRKASPVFRNAPYEVIFVPCSGWDIFFTIGRLFHLFGKKQVDVYHAFDPSSFAFSRLLSYWNGTRSILTKCGGPNPTDLYYPIPDSLIVFSKENFDYFKRRKAYRYTGIHLIPNRVCRCEFPQEKDMATLREMAGSNKIFLRISRINQIYRRSLVQSITLIRELQARGKPVVLFIIGVVEDQEVYHEMLAESSGLPVFFFTEDSFTTNASRFIGVADFVIGVGRGLMEAASLGKVLLSPIENGDIPVLVSDKTLGPLFDTNFSGRASIPDFRKEKEIGSIIDLLDDKTAFEHQQNFSRHIFSEKFDVKKAIVRYEELYRDKTSGKKVRPFDAILNLLHAARYIGKGI